MGIIDKIISLANILDKNNKFSEADTLTRIASELGELRIANPVYLNNSRADIKSSKKPKNKRNFWLLIR